jgi:hypothetical protein
VLQLQTHNPQSDKALADFMASCKNLSKEGSFMENEISTDEGKFIGKAFDFLEHPSFLLRAANAVGRPVEAILAALPQKHQRLIQKATERALHKGLTLMIKTVAHDEVVENFSRSEKNSRRSGLMHSAATFGLGAAGGFFGIMSLPVELPITTSVMLRSIAAIANEFGMDINNPQVQLECLYILSLGSPRNSSDDQMKSAYWTSRAIFSRTIGEAVGFMAGKSAADILRSLESHSAPLLVKFMSAVASRFELVVSEKFLSEAVPVVGAIGGGVINAAFTDYFSAAARYHFGLRALENRHGRKTIEDYYNTHSRRS